MILTVSIAVGLVVAPISIIAAAISAARKEGVWRLMRDTSIRVAVLVACSVFVCIAVLAILFGVSTVVDFVINLPPKPD
ncbi:hypothetical protein ACFXG4_32540 [Nocardia sp. NPDC059246]|uniref:hypothetical protein n=1 Tax=unclassified Nocardia TaxID=2637762 RepID=UPI0036763F93